MILTIQRSSSLTGLLLTTTWPCPKAPTHPMSVANFQGPSPKIAHQFPPMWAADRHLALPNGPCPHQVRHQLTKSIPQNCLPERKTILVILTIQRSSSLPGWLLKATWPCPKALNSSQVRHPFPRSIPQNCSPERDNSCDLGHTDRHLALPYGPCPHQVRH